MAEFDPEKIGYSLNIDGKYYNTLDIEGFSLMMKDPSACYKFFWLESIVQLIVENKKQASYDEIINRMIVNAWYPVLEYRIHLSGIGSGGEVKDNLEKAVNRLRTLSELGSDADKIQITNKLTEFAADAELGKYKKELTKNVPYKALSGFANKAEKEIDLNSSAGRMMTYYNNLSKSKILLPYTFDDGECLNRVIFFSNEWAEMIRDNTVTILGWIQHEKVKWLQGANPEMPGLVYKLSGVDTKTRKLSKVARLWEAILSENKVVDPFTGKYVNDEKYDIDHFVPWSFVMNDELWNLMPIDESENRKKGNRLPEWDRFFDGFVQNQFVMYNFIHQNDNTYRLFTNCYRDNLHSIWAIQELYSKGNSKEAFANILQKNMQPVYDSAKRQGYEKWVKA